MEEGAGGQGAGGEAGEAEDEADAVEEEDVYKRQGQEGLGDCSGFCSR